MELHIGSCILGDALLGIMAGGGHQHPKLCHSAVPRNEGHYWGVGNGSSVSGALLPQITAFHSLVRCLQHAFCHCGGLSGSNLLK